MVFPYCPRTKHGALPRIYRMSPLEINTFLGVFPEVLGFGVRALARKTSILTNKRPLIQSSNYETQAIRIVNPPSITTVSPVM